MKLLRVHLGLGGGSHPVKLVALSATAHNTWIQWLLECTLSFSPMFIPSVIFYTMRLGSSKLKILCTGMHQAFQELQNSAIEQRVAFAEIFNRVAFLHRFVVGESNALYSVFFHLLSGVTILLLTSSQQTAGARLILLTLVGANIYLERVICNLLLDNSKEGYDLTESISSWVGLSRRTFAGLCIAVLAYFIWTYKDPAKQSQEVLQSLQETRTEIQQLLQETERLLAKPELLFQGTKPRIEKEVLSDMGVSKLLFCSENRAEMDAKEHWADYRRNEVWTSSPRQRERPTSQTRHSLSRQHRQSQNAPTQLLMISMPVDGTPRYNLRSRQSLQDPDPSTRYEA
ncbi:uncharacterized protein LOC103048400 isoform X3 [Python bivittatus]|uniref:Uncharacterized protein LOC103048400 isoform X3 n=1 Tax=Python bivittatus TaxID=176946 RepID=A0A9F5J5L8_PYTBI|nr:uncharacterized protein LOC103048400 isoform X3 [Python bivittatus]